MKKIILLISLIILLSTLAFTVYADNIGIHVDFKEQSSIYVFGEFESMAEVVLTELTDGRDDGIFTPNNAKIFFRPAMPDRLSEDSIIIQVKLEDGNFIPCLADKNRGAFVIANKVAFPTDTVGKYWIPLDYLDYNIPPADSEESVAEPVYNGSYISLNFESDNNEFKLLRDDTNETITVRIDNTTDLIISSIGRVIIIPAYQPLRNDTLKVNIFTTNGNENIFAFSAWVDYNIIMNIEEYVNSVVILPPVVVPCFENEDCLANNYVDTGNETIFAKLVNDYLIYVVISITSGVLCIVILLLILLIKIKKK